MMTISKSIFSVRRMLLRMLLFVGDSCNKISEKCAKTISRYYNDGVRPKSGVENLESIQEFLDKHFRYSPDLGKSENLLIALINYRNLSQQESSIVVNVYNDLMELMTEIESRYGEKSDDPE